MDYKRILVESQGPIATITLNRPEAHNAFDEVMITEITGAVTELSVVSHVRAIALTGAGGSFCAGADLDWMRRVAGFTREENLADALNLQRMFASIAESPKVTIARVNGAALGGGAGLVAVCDIAIAVDFAKLGFTEVRLGLAPAVIAPFVIERIGPGAARALFVTGDRISAEEAQRIGLIHSVASASDLDAVVSRITGSVLASGPHAISETKRLLREINGKTPAESAESTVACIADLRAGEEGQEGIRAFLEKRTPSFFQDA